MKTSLRNCTLIAMLQVVAPVAGIALQQPDNAVIRSVTLSDNNTGSWSNKENIIAKEKDSSVIMERDTSFNQINTKLKIASIRLKQNTATIEKYVTDNDFNADYCFLVDMSIPSGKKRFFVYDIKKDMVVYSSLVSHGSGSYSPGCNDQLMFSNMPNSYATSLGKYKIGKAYNGTYGLSYKLYGLDSSNNNAFHRAIVIHSDKCIPETETYPRHIFESAGCPAVSPSFLNEIGKYIKASDRPTLLWIYN